MDIWVVSTLWMSQMVLPRTAECKLLGAHTQQWNCWVDWQFCVSYWGFSELLFAVGAALHASTSGVQASCAELGS